MNEKKAKLLRKLVRMQMGTDAITGGYMAKPIKGWLVNRSMRNGTIIGKHGEEISLGQRVTKQQAFIHPTSPRRHYKSLKQRIQAEQRREHSHGN